VTDQHSKEPAVEFVCFSRALNAAAQAGSGADASEQSVPVAAEQRAALIDRAKGLYRARQRRNAIFAGFEHLFGEPAWDMLLELYIAWLDGRVIGVTHATVASGATPTTGLRYMALLERAGLLARWADPDDRRCTLLLLTDRGGEIMTRYVEGLH
jgi:hypothetical protein